MNDNKYKILTELEETMTKLTVVNAYLGAFVAIQQKSHFLVLKQKLLELVGDKCKITVDEHICDKELHFQHSGS